MDGKRLREIETSDYFRTTDNIYSGGVTSDVSELCAEVRRLVGALRSVSARQERWNGEDDVSGVECVVEMGEIATDAITGYPEGG